MEQDKYQKILPQNQVELLLTPHMQHLMDKLSFILGWGFLVHTLIVLYAALRMSNLWWLLIRGIGIYVMMIICTVIASIR